MGLEIQNVGRVGHDTIISISFLSAVPSVQHLISLWVITHTAGCAAGTATFDMQTGRYPGIGRWIAATAVFIVMLPAFCPTPPSDPLLLPHQNLASK